MMKTDKNIDVKHRFGNHD